MEKTDFRVKTSVRNFVLALVLLLTTNILMGVALISMSKVTLREQIDQRMLDVANTAAKMLDGDEIKTIDAEDAGTEKYDKALNILRTFQDNIQLDYIYGIEENAEGVFTLAIDPDRVDPGDFGEPILATEALESAAHGVPSVDREPHSDRWGTFYSAYSPIYDSDNNIVGIIGVDFNAKWYEGKLNSNKAAAVVLTMVALTIGIVLSFIIMSQNRRRFTDMLVSLQKLDLETQKLDRVIMKSSIKKLDLLPDRGNEVLKTLANGESGKKQVMVEDYAGLNASIENVYSKLKRYLEYIENEVYVDDMTSALNKGAYRRKTKLCDERIKEGIAAFSIAFFDINGTKKIYAHFGYEAGDKLLFECAKILKHVFGDDNVFHIIGDEYIVIVDNAAKKDMELYFAAFDEAIEKYNEEHKAENLLSVSKGGATFDAKKHNDYRTVFLEAKNECDKDRTAYHNSLHKKDYMP